MLGNYETLLKRDRELYLRKRTMERNTHQSILLLVFNILILIYIHYCMKACNVTINLSHNFFYLIIFSLIFIILFIYGIVQRKMMIDIIFYIKLFLFLNIIFLLYSLKYILYLHNASPYITLIKVENLFEISHKITIDFAVYCARAYCSRFNLIMIEEKDLFTICNLTTDFQLIQEKLEMRNEFLLKESIQIEKEKAQKGTFLGIFNTAMSYFPSIFTITSMLISYAHTPMYCFNFLDLGVIILLEADFPEEIFDDFEGLFYFLYPERDEVCNFITGII